MLETHVGQDPSLCQLSMTEKGGLSFVQKVLPELGKYESISDLEGYVGSLRNTQSLPPYKNLLLYLTLQNARMDSLGLRAMMSRLPGHPEPSEVDQDLSFMSQVVAARRAALATAREIIEGVQRSLNGQPCSPGSVKVRSDLEPLDTVIQSELNVDFSKLGSSSDQGGKAESPTGSADSTQSPPERDASGNDPLGTGLFVEALNSAVTYAVREITNRFTGCLEGASSSSLAQGSM